MTPSQLRVAAELAEERRALATLSAVIGRGKNRISVGVMNVPEHLNAKVAGGLAAFCANEIAKLDMRLASFGVSAE